MDEQGAESSKIDATQASIRKLLTKLNVCIKAIGAISSRIHKLRDEELQPQVGELIHGYVPSQIGSGSSFSSNFPFLPLSVAFRLLEVTCITLSPFISLSNNCMFSSRV